MNYKLCARYIFTWLYFCFAIRKRIRYRIHFIWQHFSEEIFLKFIYSLGQYNALKLIGLLSFEAFFLFSLKLWFLYLNGNSGAVWVLDYFLKQAILVASNTCKKLYLNSAMVLTIEFLCLLFMVSIYGFNEGISLLLYIHW